MNAFFILVALGCIASVGYYLWADRNRMQMLRFHVKKMHGSPLFADLTPLLRRAQNRPIEQLTIDKTGLTLRFMQPVGSVMSFQVRDYGYAYLTPEKQEALLVLLEQFLPLIVDSHRYALRKRRTWLLNGKSEISYQYTILTAYKTSLVRAPHYEGGKQKLSYHAW